MWVAVGLGDNDSIATSYDGMNWQGRGKGDLTIAGYGIAWNGSMWVAVGSGNNHTIATSYDGMNWQGRGKGDLTNAGYGIAWNGSMWVAVGYGAEHSIATSYDGMNWQGRGGKTNLFTFLGNDVAWNSAHIGHVTINHPIVAACEDITLNNSGSTLAYSNNDGLSWRGLGNTVFKGDASGNCIAWNGNVWVAGCNANGDANVEHTLAYSYDGLQWTGIGKTLFSNAVNDVAWNGERWLAIGSDLDDGVNTKIASSSDGITWYDASSSSISSTILNSGSCLAWNGSYWLAGGYGTGSETTEQIPARYASIAAGGSHSLALMTNGKVYAWGYNFYGQLGLSTSGDDADEKSPTLITALSNITVSSIAAGNEYSLALTTDGKVYAWGNNFNGHLGLGTSGDDAGEDSPTLITALSNITVSSIDAGYSHSLALTTDGKVYAWGSNGNGQLGLGNNEEKKSPTLITALSNITVSSIAAGGYNSLALTTDGKVYSWGLNYYGQLGLGTIGSGTDRKSPTLYSSFFCIF